jgi:hypothetical protein
MAPLTVMLRLAGPKSLLIETDIPTVFFVKSSEKLPNWNPNSPTEPSKSALGFGGAELTITPASMSTTSRIEASIAPATSTGSVWMSNFRSLTISGPIGTLPEISPPASISRPCPISKPTSTSLSGSGPGMLTSMLPTKSPVEAM